MTDQVVDQLTDFIRPRLGGHPLDPSDDIFARGFVNSLFAMELVVFVEATFGFVIPNEDLRLDNFRTPNAVADLVRRHLPTDA